MPRHRVERQHRFHGELPGGRHIGYAGTHVSDCFLSARAVERELDEWHKLIEVQNGMVERNAGLPPERRIEFRIGIHLGDVVEESDGDLMDDGVNIAARLEGIAAPGAICLSEQAYWQV